MNLFLAYAFTFFKRKKKIILVCLIALILVSGLGWILAKSLSKPTLTEGIVGTYQEKDFPLQITSLISKPLITVDKSGNPQNNLVEGWEVSNEAKEYKFVLKKDLYWSDGTKVKSSDIRFSIPDVDVSFPDDNTIVFKLSDSFSPFPTLLTTPVLKNDSLTGIGPYTIKQIKKDGLFVSRIRLTSTDKSLPELIIKFYPSEKIARTALKLGEIEALVGVGEPGELKSNQNINLQSFTNYEQLVTVFYNTKDPILSDENFRLALSFYAPSIQGEEEAKTSLPTHSWAFNDAVKDYLDNPDQGKAYLNKVKNGKDSTITLTATSSLQHVGERIVQSWNQNGIKSVLRVESGIPQNFQALLITQNIPTDPDQYSLWHSTQEETNISKISSPRIDKDLEDGRKIASQEARKAKYQDFQKILMDQSPATFMYYPKYNVAYLKKSESKIRNILPLQFPKFRN